ncbi:MAG: hypothetical protein ACRDL3_06615, partial [Solirubrobacterales bacterium]
VLLFFGSAGTYIVRPIGFTIIFSIAAGLAALLFLERGDGRGDRGGCVSLAVSIATFSTGLAFAVGVAVSVLVRPDRWRRAWIFAVPLALYAVWWVWAAGSAASSRGQTKLSNLLLVPNYVADAAAAGFAALTGLGYDFTASPDEIPLGWGYVIAVAAVVALAIRVTRRTAPVSLWVALAIVLTSWVLGALAFNALRLPAADRFIYMGTVGILLVGTAAATGIRFSRFALVALFAVCAMSLATNLALLRDRGAAFRSSSLETRAEIAMVALARAHVDPAFDVRAVIPSKLGLTTSTGDYLRILDGFGSPGFTIPELEREPEAVREYADRVLAGALELRAERSAGPRPGDRCRVVRAATPAGTVDLELPPGGARLRARDGSGGAIALGRFADTPAAEGGRLDSRAWAALRIPVDVSQAPWTASVSGTRAVEVCDLS